MRKWQAEKRPFAARPRPPARADVLSPLKTGYHGYHGYQGTLGYYGTI
jgi:hypothetical protein